MVASRSAKSSKASKPKTTVSAKKKLPQKSSTTREKSLSKFQQEVDAGKIVAIDRVQAIIEFDVDGTILTANRNFLSATGYSLEEIQGKHHRIFVDASFASSSEYRAFWDKLARGEFDSGEYRRLTKSGTELWLNASYNPVFNSAGEVFRVVKYATDITTTKQRNADYQGQITAINKSQAVIEFNLDGTILHANENFCTVLGYSLNEIQGKHHRIFCETDYTNSQDYRQFWDSLRQGHFQSGQYKRLARSGREIWIQASYNPIFDHSGRPCKVVKFATDITAQKELELKLIASQKREDEYAAEKAKLERVLSFVNAIAEGDFSRDVLDLGDDAIGQVASALRVASQSIRQTLQDVKEVSSTVASAAEQLNVASREISSGAQTQASSLEETASSLEEITSTIKQNSDNAQQARQLANGSRDVAEKGGAVVSDAVSAMAEINQSSKKIADIITTIDEIAFQTNLLALNAAVEAARAGEQGRGFAVVAAEVRNLAQRSASAAKEIKALIQDSVQRVENGTQLVNKSGETLNEIVGSVKRVTDIVAEIAAASKEQLAGVEQVNKAVSQMDRVTQANASQTEEVSGTASTLLSHAEQLREQINSFKLGGEAQSPRRSSEPRSNSKPGARTSRNPDRRFEQEFDRVHDGVTEVLEF